MTKGEILQKQIDKERATIRTDAYPISIGELASMYHDEELNIHPEFQRYYRWDENRKSKFIESILLGIPIPSVFVAQQADGVWDVVDGLQRLSTIFEFMGVLKDENGRFLPALALTETKYLPALDGMVWSDNRQSKLNLDSAQKLFFKRAKLDVKILLRESSEKTKFELFQRLNTGGATLSEQEIRNAMLVAGNKPFFDWLRELSRSESFVATTGLSERQLDEQYDVELVLRFLVFRTLNAKKLAKVGDLGDFLTAEMMLFSDRFESLKDDEKLAFNRTFDLLDSAMGSNSFRKYDTKTKRFLGGFSISAFEVVACGIGFNALEKRLMATTKIVARASGVWTNTDFLSSSGSGIRASSRIPKTIPLGRKEFKV